MAPKAKCIKKENFHNFHITPNTSLPAILHVLYVLRSRIRRWCAMLTGAKFDWLTDWLIDWLIDWSALFVIQTLALSDARIATWRRTCAISESEMMISCSESQRLTYISIDWLIDCLIDMTYVGSSPARCRRHLLSSCVILAGTIEITDVRAGCFTYAAAPCRCKRVWLESRKFRRIFQFSTSLATAFNRATYITIKWINRTQGGSS